ncbi:MAG: hypothetical protein VXY93_13890, partial [Pseudomonadota bacterium]|nr:hypothetical protein [Pseudomonadota bacterium]
MKFMCWDGNSTETFLFASGVGGYVDIMGTNMGNNGSKAPLLRVAGHSGQAITMYSSDGTNLTERFKLSQGGFNFTGLSTHTGNFDLDGDLDVDGHTNLDNVSIAGVTTITSSANAALYVAGRSVLGNDTLLPTFGAGTLAVVSNLSGNGNWVDLSILGGRTGRSIVKFGDHDDQDAGAIKYYHTDNSLNFTTNGSSTERLIIKSTGNVEITNDLDVDGHTNLDNVSIAGVTTHSDNVSIVKSSGPILELCNNTNTTTMALRLHEGVA